MILNRSRCYSKFRLLVLTLLIALSFGATDYSVGQSLEDYQWQGQPTWSPTGELIAFVASRSDGDRRADLWTMNSDGSNAVNRTYVMVTYYNGLPKWSPNGQYIAFQSVSDVDATRNDVLILDIAANTIVNLTYDLSNSASGFVWSPNSQYLAFLSGSTIDNRDLYVTDVGKTFLVSLTPAQSGFISYPAWMSDDIVTFVNANGILTAMSILDGSVTELLPEPIVHYSVSPDRRYIAYTTTSDLAYYDLWLLSLGDRHTHSLASDLYLVSDLVWAYQSDRFLVEALCEHENSAIWQVTINPYILGDLTGCDNANNMLPSWSPDDSQIAFMSDRSGPMNLWMMNADGSNPINLSERIE